MKRILIVDDSRMTRILVHRALVDAGFESASFVQASNGAEALGLLRNDTFDLMVTDLYMDRLTGVELVRDMRAEGIDTPVCMVTSERSPTVLAEAREVGVNWLVSKPFRPAQFAELLSA